MRHREEWNAFATFDLGHIKTISLECLKIDCLWRVDYCNLVLSVCELIIENSGIKREEQTFIKYFLSTYWGSIRDVGINYSKIRTNLVWLEPAGYWIKDHFKKYVSMLSLPEKKEIHQTKTESRKILG